MNKLLIALLFLFFSLPSLTMGYEKDSISTSQGDLSIHFLGHGSLLLQFKNKNIYIDPYSNVANYNTLPKADFIFITHEHPDHLDPKALQIIKTNKTQIYLNQKAFDSYKSGFVLKNGENKKLENFTIEVLPAYNIAHKRPSGAPFHLKGEGNGYLFTFADKRVFVAGDTENTPEIKALKNIDVAFLPMNLPFTMTPEMSADVALAMKPKIFYPYHYGDTKIEELINLLKNHKEIDVRVREMK